MAGDILTSFVNFLFPSERIDSSVFSDVNWKLCLGECKVGISKDSRKSGMSCMNCQCFKDCWWNIRSDCIL